MLILFDFQSAERGGRPLGARKSVWVCMDYLSATLAPVSSSFFLAASASALGAPSRIGLGAPSTRPLASARPRPAFTSRTALMTAIFLSAGTEARITSKAVLASAAGAAAAPPGPAAAALTPHLPSSSFTRSAISITVALLSSSTSFALSRAIFPFVSSSPVATGGLSLQAGKPTIYVVFVFFVYFPPDRLSRG